MSVTNVKDPGKNLTGRNCFCTKRYQCLSCEKEVNRRAMAEARAIAIAEGRKLERKVAQCGTRAGYNRHLKQGEPTCADCKQAQLEAVQRWQANKKAMQYEA